MSDPVNPTKLIFLIVLVMMLAFACLGVTWMITIR